jgi:hypothetical protein
LSWIKHRTATQSFNILMDVARSCASLGGPLSKSLLALLEKSPLEVVNFKFDYLLETTPDDFFYARQIQALVSKQDFLDFGIDTEKAAFETFLACEQKCLETDNRLYSQPVPNGTLAVVFYHARQKMAAILGDIPSLESLDFCFGPGATTSVKHSVAHPLMKLTVPLECSKNFLMGDCESLRSVAPHWLGRSVNSDFLSTPSKLVFVPKSSKTDRPIGIEPTINGFFQKGIGNYLKKRLRFSGVDLSTQELNREAAYRGSINGTLSTIDLSSASDTISCSVVLELLPLPWVDFLDRFRSTEATYKGVTYSLQRFSSMGNAYTFELETAIFYSLCYGVYKSRGLDHKNLLTYGDDIIVDTEVFDSVVEVLEYCGFSLNRDKSFSSGPFRESCGADFYMGFDIRPFYLREKLSDRVLFLMHNWFLRNGENTLARVLIKHIKSHNRRFGPDGFGDGHLIGTYSLRTNRRLKRLGYEGGFFSTFCLKPKRLLRLLRGVDDTFVYPLYCIYVSGESSWFNPTSLPDHTIVPGNSGYHLISIYTLQRTIFRRPV